MHVLYLKDPFNMNSTHLRMQSAVQLCKVRAFIWLPLGFFSSIQTIWADSIRWRDGGTVWMRSRHVLPVVSEGSVIPGRGHYKERTRSRQSHFTQTLHWSGSAALWVAPPVATVSVSRIDDSIQFSWACLVCMVGVLRDGEMEPAYKHIQ